MAQPSSSEPGRNDPCPCGSGRKYKQCCLQNREAEEAVRSRLREIEGRLVPEIFRWAIGRWDFFAEAWEEFFLWERVPEDIEDNPEFNTIFIPWLVFSFVPDPKRAGARNDLPEHPAAIVYLQEHLDRLSEVDGRFILSACSTPFSFYAVRDVTPGRDILLRNILTGQERRVLEHSASTMVRRDAILFAHAVTVDNTSIMLGCAPPIIPPSWHNTILDLRQQIAKRRTPNERDLFEWAADIRHLYLHIADHLRNPRPPVLQNTDGDPIALTTMEFDLRCSVEAAFERLKSLSLYDDDDLLQDAERTPEGGLRSVEVPWMKAGNRQHKEWDNTILGHLTIEPGRITANVNSKRRADRLRREIVKRLRADAVHAGSREEPIEQLLEEHKQAAGGGPEIRLKPDPTSRRRTTRAGERPDATSAEMDMPEMRQALEQMMARRWEAWLDEKIPALGNRTPRQAAKTALGRERLEALLADYTWQSQRAPAHERPDIPALRRKLGM